MAAIAAGSPQRACGPQRFVRMKSDAVLHQNVSDALSVRRPHRNW
jgi:hypothetical protein